MLRAEPTPAVRTMDWSNLLERAPALLLAYGLNLLAALAILMIGKWIARRVVAVGGRVMKTRGLDPTVVGFVSNIAFMVLLMIVVIAALGQLGIPTASFVAAIGAAGLAIGLALQGSLSNFASGVLLVTFRPAKVGDYIEAAGVAGTVEAITVFSTTLVTPDRRTITVPNSKLFDGPIVNYSTSSKRRLDLVFGIAYSSDVDRAQRILRTIVDSDPRVLEEDKPVQIGVLALADSSVNIAVRPFVGRDDYWPMHFDLHARVKREFDAAGISIPFPQVEVHLPGRDVDIDTGTPARLVRG